jgi:hypothetical protein
MMGAVASPQYVYVVRLCVQLSLLPSGWLLSHHFAAVKDTTLCGLLDVLDAHLPCWCAVRYAGWGAFLGRAAVKDDFLGEYVGELLSQAEADRRGKAYDRSNNSYLFGVNSAWVLDAKDSGNNLRFANHRSQPNCQARCVEAEYGLGFRVRVEV